MNFTVHNKPNDKSVNQGSNLTKPKSKRCNTYCVAKWCRNKVGSKPGTSFFRVPKNRTRAVEWLMNADREDLKDEDLQFLHDKYLCAEHFTDNMFMNSLKNKLVWNAVPTLFTKPRWTPRTKLPVHLSQQKSEEDMTILPIALLYRKILPKSQSMCGEPSPLKVPNKSQTPSTSASSDYLSVMGESTASVKIETKDILQEAIIPIFGEEGTLCGNDGDDDHDIYSMLKSDFNENALTDCSFTMDIHGVFNNSETEILGHPFEKSNEEMHSCLYCGEVFLVESSLILHQTTYHPETSVGCEFCGKAVYSKSEYMEHACEQSTK